MSDRSKMSNYYPEKIGLAVDPLLDPYAHLAIASGRCRSDERALHDFAEALLLFPTVVLPADYPIVERLYEYFSVEDLKPLLEDGRLLFCCPWGVEYRFITESTTGTSEPVEKTEEWPGALARSLNLMRAPVQSSPNDIVDQVGAFSLPQCSPSEVIEDAEQAILDAFGQTAAKILPQHREDPWYHFFVFRQHVHRMLWLWASGILPIHADCEFGSYLALCGPKRADTRATFDHLSLATLHSLHSIAHLPTLSAAIATGELDKKSLLRVLQSDEAATLREWIRANLRPGLDVRDAYYGSLGSLPSKKKWVTWLRFGVTSSIATALGFLVSQHPVLATALGVSAGVADMLTGDHVARQLDPYHPSHWLSFYKRHMGREQSG